jgi:hypothetical protein
VSVAAESVAISPGWLRGRVFDGNLIFGIAALALVSGWVVVQFPALFVPILLADLWLLGYHHVVATFTRLCFDRQSFRTHRFLVLGLPPIVIAGVLLMALGIGWWTLATLYLYWQWFHYSRQSWGISRIYARKAGGLVVENEHLAKLAFYLVPLWGILSRSYQDPGMFLGLELKVLTVPELALDLVGAAALVALGWWLMVRVQMWREGRLPLAHTLFMISHFVIFYVGYILIDDINAGWLVLNIWHNGQYIALVWMYNNNRFKAGIDPKAKFLSTLSQERNLWRYLLVCFAISTIIYATLESTVAALPLFVVIYQAINFHHYIVDGVIWKVRRKTLQRTLGIAS